MNSSVRVRFAPSPTGSLHIGGVRTALFNWLYARRLGGKFLLRIEDTDLERSEDRFTQDILGAMKWLGLDWDEEPLYQSRRMKLYRDKVDELVSKGHAYWCRCTEADVEKMRERQLAAGKKPMYDRHCRELGHSAPKAGEQAACRLKIPEGGWAEFNDLIRGPIRVANEEIDDFVLIRSNGAPTYNLSVVVDDAESRITHVIRGDDHINNTPKQIHLYRYFDWSPPDFAHLPMILGQDKKKLSKRNAVTAVSAYRGEGYLPETLLNFLARLGWSHGDQEVFTLEEMIQYFGFDHVQKSGAVWNPEKLLWLNGEHIRKASAERLAQIVCDDYLDYFRGSAKIERLRTKIGTELVKLIQPKVKLSKELAEQLPALCTPGPVEVDASGLKWAKNADLKTVTQGAIRHAVEHFEEKLSRGPKEVKREGGDSVWGTVPSLGDLGVSHTDIDQELRQIGEQCGVKLGDLVQPMRLTVTGRMVSASLFDLMAILPWDIVGPRLKQAAELP